MANRYRRVCFQGSGRRLRRCRHSRAALRIGLPLRCQLRPVRRQQRLDETLAISHKEGDKAVLDLVREVKPPFSPESVVEDFCRDLKRYNLRKVSGDRYGGLWPSDQFRKHGVRYDVADKTASQLFQEALPLINGATARLLDHKRLLDQLVNLERRTSFGSGRDSIGHPPGAHDDIAVAVAGALLGAAARPRKLLSNVRQDGPGGNLASPFKRP